MPYVMASVHAAERESLKRGMPVAGNAPTDTNGVLDLLCRDPVGSFS
jgi:hypothetical protein